MRKSKFPPGWDEERVHRVLAHYEGQTEEETVAEDEAAFEGRSHTVMEILNELVPIAQLYHPDVLEEVRRIYVINQGDDHLEKERLQDWVITVFKLLADYTVEKGPEQVFKNSSRVVERVRKLAETMGLAVAEDEAASKNRTYTIMEVPNELVPAIRELIAKHH